MAWIAGPLVRAVAIGLALGLGAVACGGGDSDAADSTDERARTEDAVAESGVPESDVTEDAREADDPAPAEAPPPSGPPLLEGLAPIEVLGPPESEAGETPLFRWSPVEGASTYDLVVLSPDAPIWAWQGPETRIYMGGLEIEPPEGLSVPVIVTGSCWSVVALDAEDQLVAASEFLPVSPGESPGHSCLPGLGSDYTP